MKVEDAMRKAKEKVEEANRKADPVVDSWLKKLVDSPLTPIWMVVALVGIVVLWIVLK